MRIRHTGYMQLNLKDELLPQSVLKMSCLSTTTFVQGVYEYVHVHLARGIKHKDFIELKYVLLTFHIEVVGFALYVND